MNTAFQPQRDIVLGHVPNAPATLNEGSSSGKSILYGAAGIKRAISISSRDFEVVKADTPFFFDGGLPLEQLAISGLRERGLFGLAGLSRLTGTGVGR